jgi:uncharacterized membrane protein
LNPSASLYARRAEALTASGENRKALADVERAIAIAPSNNEARELRDKLLNLPQPKYKIIDLGTLGGPRSLAYGMNGLGHVTGFSSLPSTPGGPTPEHAFLYDGELHDLGVLPETPRNVAGPSSFGHSINDRDQIVGDAVINGSVAFLWDPEHGMRNLGFADTHGTSINNPGDVLVAPALVAPSNHPLLIRPPTVRETILPPQSLPGCFLSPNAVNDSGEVVGYCSTTSGGTPFQAFAWDRIRGTHLLESPGTIQSLAWSLNNSDQVIGSVGFGVGIGRAVIWDSTGMRVLPTISAVDGKILNTDGYGINDRGYAVGMGTIVTGPTSATQYAVLWIRSVGYILDNLIPQDSGWHLIETHSINNAGQIAGYGTAAGQTRAFRLDPVQGQ